MRESATRNDPAGRAAPPVDAAADPAASDRRLGEVVHFLRRRAGMTLQELAAATGLSAGMLSLLERGRATPSVRTLRLLSLALGVPIAYFFEAPPGEEAESPWVVRKGARRLLRLTASGVLKESVAPAVEGEMEMYELTLAPGSASGTDFLSHLGEKAGYVLEGRMRLWLDHQANILEAGDSFRFPSTVPHMFDNPAAESCRVLWICIRRLLPPRA